ncbi:peptidoglycan-binding protein [Pedobacter sp. L105]|uniref:peptidoglycan-binding protein n=1 Tax=Pedobacter sp. L105 TaxID=1641871 RepID=UPI00131AC9F9|nr:peptidoglycan-binding protein [Pedobacter sp. L105]
MALVSVASREVGVRELTQHNDGKRVEEYLALTHLKKGNPWCASFVSFVFAQCGYSKPRSAWCPDLFPDSRLATSALPGDIMGIYFPEKKRIAHVGLVIHQLGSWVTTCEGNTDVAGSREGDGVYKKLRHIKTIHSISDWVSERRKVP